jgi:hypothetical protein
MEAKQSIGRGHVLLEVLTSEMYVGIATAGALAYFWIINYLVASSNYGIFLISVPVYIVYLMVGTAGILLALGIFSIRNALLGATAAAEEGVLSAALPSIGSLAVTCSCTYPFLGTVLLFFGASSLEVSAVISYVAAYQAWILAAIIVVNLLLIHYYLGRLAKAERRIYLGGRRRA